MISPVLKVDLLRPKGLYDGHHLTHAQGGNQKTAYHRAVQNQTTNLLQCWVDRNWASTARSNNIQVLYVHTCCKTTTNGCCCTHTPHHSTWFNMQVSSSKWTNGIFVVSMLTSRLNGLAMDCQGSPTYGFTSNCGTAGPAWLKVEKRTKKTPKIYRSFNIIRLNSFNISRRTRNHNRVLQFNVTI